MSYAIQVFETPVGKLYLVGHGESLCGVIFEKMWPQFRTKFATCEEKETPLLMETKQQLTQYFNGMRQAFNLPLLLLGTDFQKKAWAALAQIPFGQKATYKQQCEIIQATKAMRAVGRTNGINPLCIVLPCHRIVGSNGSLTGYAGGLDVKEFLLRHERARPLS